MSCWLRITRRLNRLIVFVREPRFTELAKKSCVHPLPLLLGYSTRSICWLIVALVSTADCRLSTDRLVVQLERDRFLGHAPSFWSTHQLWFARKLGTCY